MRILPTSALLVAVSAVLAPTALASVTVDPVAGNDATCADDGAACATLGRATQVADAAPGATTILLGPGTFPVTDAVLLTGQDRIVGRGGLQSYIRMLGPNAHLGLLQESAVAGVVVGGEVWVDGWPGFPQSWVGLSGNATLQDTTVLRVGRGGGVYANGGGTTLRRVMVATSQAQGADWAMSTTGRVAMMDSTVSGGGINVIGSGPVGSARAPALIMNRSVVWGGMWQYSGDSVVANSLVVGRPSFAGFTMKAIQVLTQPMNPFEPRTTRMQFVLSTAWQPDCGPAFGLMRPDDATRVPSLVVAGSLAGGSCAGGQLAGAAVALQAPGAVNALYQLALQRPYLVYANAARNPQGIISPAAAPCCLVATQDPPPLLGTDPRIRRMPTSASGLWPVDFAPVAGSPLLGAATDPLSAQVAATYGAGLDGVARPAANQTIGANQGVVGEVALPGPVGVGPVPAPEGGWAPAGNGVPGAVPDPGAPTAGQADPAVPALDLSELSSGAVGVEVSVPKKSKVTAALPVTVTTDRAARVVVVVRRPVMGSSGVVGTRVLGKVVGTFDAAGSKVLKVRFKASTQRGGVLVGATARTSGAQPGMDTENSFLTGPAPVVIAAQSSVRAGGNTVALKVNRTGNVVLVGRTATGRVLGRTSFTATSRGTRRVSLVLGPSRLVSGVVTLSAKVAGGEPVTITRPVR